MSNNPPLMNLPKEWHLRQVVLEMVYVWDNFSNVSGIIANWGVYVSIYARIFFAEKVQYGSFGENLIEDKSKFAWTNIWVICSFENLYSILVPKRSKASFRITL